MPQHQSPWLPQTYRHCFRVVWNDDAPADPSTPALWYEVDIELDEVAADVVGLGEGMQGVSGSTRVVRDSCPALFDLSHKTTPSNDAALQALAKRAATDFYSWRLVGAGDRTFPGVYDWQPDGIHDYEIVFLPAAIGKTYKARAIAWPRRDEPEEYQHCDRVDPTLPGDWYFCQADSNGIKKAISSTMMSDGTVSVLQTATSHSGAITPLKDAYGVQVKVTAWNADPGGAIAPSAYGGIKRNAQGKWIWTYEPCAAGA